MKDKIYVVEKEAANGTILLASNDCNDYCKQNNAVEYVRKDALIDYFSKLKQERVMGYIFFEDIIYKLQIM